MPQYKLIYFNTTVRAEVARMMFALSGVEFEDHRLSGAEEWFAMKAGTPFGQLPILEVDGHMLCQSHAINRYLARNFGYAGKTAWEQARVDMVASCVQDMLEPYIHMFRKVRKDARTVTDDFKEETRKSLAFQLRCLEKMLMENKSGYFVGDELTWADLLFAEGCTWPKLFNVEPFIDLTAFPTCSALKKKVFDNPRVAAWVERRPPKITATFQRKIK